MKIASSSMSYTLFAFYRLMFSMCLFCLFLRLFCYIQDQIHQNNSFKHQLKSLLKSFPNVDTSAMGFPKDWEMEALWV